jgi:hypothetical protein
VSAEPALHAITIAHQTLTYVLMCRETRDLTQRIQKFVRERTQDLEEATHILYHHRKGPFASEDYKVRLARVGQSSDQIKEYLYAVTMFRDLQQYW